MRKELQSKISEFKQQNDADSYKHIKKQAELIAKIEELNNQILKLKEENDETLILNNLQLDKVKQQFHESEIAEDRQRTETDKQHFEQIALMKKQQEIKEQALLKQIADLKIQMSKDKFELIDKEKKMIEAKTFEVQEIYGCFEFEIRELQEHTRNNEHLH